MDDFISSRSNGEGSKASRGRFGGPARGKGDRSAPTRAWRVHPITVLILCGGILLASIGIGTTMMVLHFRDRAVANTERELTNTALLLARHLDEEFGKLSLLQERIAEMVHSAGIDSVEDYERRMSGQDTHLILRDKVRALPQVAGAALIGADGKLINFSRFWPIPPVNVADREFFKALESNPRLKMVVSEPLRNRADGALTVVLARRIAAPNGEFLGLVLGSIDPGYFGQFFGSLALGRHSTITLFRDDGVMLARHPRIESAIGNTYRGYVDVLRDGDARTAVLTATADGRERLMTARRLADFPLVVAVSIEVAAMLADWWEQTRFLIAIAALSAVVIAVILFLIVRQLLQEHEWSQQRLALEKQRLDTAVDNMSQGLLMFDSSERIVVCNQRYLEMYGLSPAVAKPGCAFRELINHRKATGSFTGDIGDYCSSVMDDLRRGKATQQITETADGRWIKIVNHPMAGGGWVATHEDITLQRNAEQARERDREFLNRIIDNVPTTIIVKDARERRYVLINRAAEAYFGASRDQIIGKTVRDIYPKAEAEMVIARDEQQLRSGGALFFGEYPIDTLGMGRRIVTSNRVTIFDSAGEPQYLVSVVEDVTERKRAAARIAHLAHHDALTDLPNRLLFRERLDQSLKWARHGEHVAVLYLDLDNFKSVNDAFGHPAGDELLKAVAGRLRGCLGETDSVARLGGDEFAIIQTAVERPADVTDLVKRIQEAVRSPLDPAGPQFATDASIGIAMAPEDGTDPDQLLKNAELALDGAKAEGRGTYRFFEPDMDARVKAKRALEVDLREAIMSDRFELHYQPVVDLRENRISGCEALLRWRDAKRGMVEPAEFIPVAEETGLIVPLGEWALRAACAEAMTWPDNVKVAVNVSPAQFKSPTLSLAVVGALAASGLPARRLELEITEAVFIRDAEAARVILDQLRGLGVRIAMDDFGTGYSSLSYLQRFPFDKIKIDRSFVTNITGTDGSPDIVQAVVGIARSRNITTTAEGVETTQQLELLRKLGCTEMQGLLFSPPISAAAMSRLLLPQRERAAGAA